MIKFGKQAKRHEKVRPTGEVQRRKFEPEPRPVTEQVIPTPEPEEGCIKRVKMDTMDADHIVPVIFTPEGICGNAQPFLKPILNFEHFNETLNTESALKDMTRSEIHDLKWNNNSIIMAQLRNYIVQQAFLSFCGYLDSLEAVNHLNVMRYTDIRQKCYNYLANSEVIKGIIDGMFRFNTPFSSETFNTRPESLYHYCGLNAKQISHTIHTIFCMAIEESVNDLILLNPYRLETQYAINTCVSFSAELRSVREQNPNNIPSTVAIWLKTLLMSKIDDLMSVIAVGVCDVIVYTGSTNFFTFADYLKSMTDIRYDDEESPF